MSDTKVEEVNHCNLNFDPQNASSWVDVFVHEMMNASDWNDVRSRATQMLEAFEKSVITNSVSSYEVYFLYVWLSFNEIVLLQTGQLNRSSPLYYVEQQEVTSLKEQLQSLLRDNQILKKAVAIQHERSLEQDEKLKEMQHLKHVLSKYHEQVQALEV